VIEVLPAGLVCEHDHLQEIGERAEEVIDDRLGLAATYYMTVATVGAARAI
jgi:hypothetical protein